MIVDVTEMIRRRRQAEINSGAEKQELAQRYEVVWDSTELGELFAVIGFMAPFVVVKRKSDGKKGSLEFQHYPRFYFNWREDR